MTSERIKEIQEETAYPNSVSVKQALLKVWNECEQEKVKNKCVNFFSDSKTTSATVCKFCGKEKHLH